MTPAIWHESAVTPALSILGPKFASPQAEVLMVAWPIQESGLRHRVQIRGPARGYPQFEIAGIVSVMTNPVTRDHARRACEELNIEFSSRVIYEAVKWCDTLAAIFMRLMLWAHPYPLPSEESAAFLYYDACARPRDADENRWPEAWARAVETVYG